MAEYNLINTDKFPIYKASLIKEGYTDLYIEIGLGDASWDSSDLPVPNPGISSLIQGVYRKKIDHSTATYVDPATLEVSAVPTRCVKLSVTITAAEYNGVIREYGIFGIDATSTLDTGEMIIYCDHKSVMMPVATNYTKDIYLLM